MIMNQEKCHKCDKNSVWTNYTNKNFCESHFLGLLEKRVRKNIRIKKMIDIKKTYSLEQDEDNKYLLTTYFLRRIFSDRLKISKKGTKIVSNTMDDEAHNLLMFFANNEELDTHDLKPLSVITDEEAKILAKILNVELKIKENMHSQLTKKDPQILFSMMKSKEFLEKRKK